jgi:chromate transporter
MNWTKDQPDLARHATPTASLTQLFVGFLYLGLVGFGGGSAILGLMERECVEKRKYVSEDEFQHGLALGQILGSYAVNTAFFVGYQSARLQGALVAVAGFLLPSFLIVVGLSALYFRFHHVPQLNSALAGIGPVVIALILWAAYITGKGKLKHPFEYIAFALAFLAAAFHINTLWILLAAGIFGALRCTLKRRAKS